MTNLCKTVFAILVLAISGTAFSGEPLSKDPAVAPAAQPAVTLFGQAPSATCYPCGVGGGTAYCHSSGQYYRKYPCSSSDNHSLPHTGTCPSPSNC